MTVISVNSRVPATARTDDAVAVMGGTFDPVHHGHLRTALEIRELLDLQEVRLIPCHRPPHRETPGCGATHRLRMVELAVADERGLTVDDRELHATGPSYTVNTLQSLRAELGDRTPLIMVVGMDAFLGLPAWHRWEELIQLANILVVQRPGWHFSDGEPMAEWVRPLRVDAPEMLKQEPAGRVLIHGLTPLGISATQIRERIGAGGSPRFLLPDAVWNYIRVQGLYSVRK